VRVPISLQRRIQTFRPHGLPRQELRRAAGVFFCIALRGRSPRRALDSSQALADHLDALADATRVGGKAEASTNEREPRT
jgi:hypothetical protein